MNDHRIEEIPIYFEDNTSTTIEYSRKDMGSYHAHVFLCGFHREEELKNHWEAVTNEIALEIQSHIDSVIERANFYIGYFCEDPVSLELQNRIEEDPYCARKYVFDQPQQWKNKAETMEQHIFALGMQGIPTGTDRNRLSAVCLQNFRGFRGKAKFDLTDSKGNPASFVLIYAPNGIGKTSFMDGIEFALRGEVDRLLTLEKNSRKTGPVYHNYDRTDQKAYVQLFVKNGQHQDQAFEPRPVPKYENGTDTNTDNRTYKKSIKSTKEDWNMVILPHDRIDSFITANTPEERYNSWTKADTRINTTAKALRAIRKKLRDAENEKNNVAAKRDFLKSELEELKVQEEGLQRVLSLVQEYRELASKASTLACRLNGDRKEKEQETNDPHPDHFPLITPESDIGTYEQLLTEVRVALDQIGARRNQLHYMQDEFRQWIEAGPEKTDRFYEQYLKNSDREKALKQEEELLSKRVKLTDLIARLQAELRKREDEITSEAVNLDKKISTTESELNYLEEVTLKGFDAKLDCRKEAVSKLQQYEELKALYNEEYKKVYLLAEQYKLADNSPWDFEPSVLQDLIFTDSRKEDTDATEVYSMDDPDISAMISHLNQLKEAYKKADGKLNKLLNDHNKQSGALLELQNQAVSYLEQHRETCQCPVCHSNFGSWQKMLSNIRDIKAGEEEDYEERLEEASGNKKKLEEDYYQALEDAKELIAAVGKKLQEHLNTLKNQIQDLEDWFTSSSIIKNKESLNRYQVNYYYATLQKEKDQYQKQMSILSAELTSCKKRREQLDDLEHRDSKTKSIWEKLEDADLSLKSFDSKYPEIRYLSEDNLRKELSLTESQLASQESFATEYKPYYQHPEKLLEVNSVYLQFIENLNGQSEKLNRILCEEGIRAYFESWKNKNAEYQQHIATADQANTDYETCKEENDLFESELKQELETYFSQENANIIYRKIDPNNDLTDMRFSLTYSKNDQPQLNYEMTRSSDPDKKGYTAELYLSTAQLNAVAFSSFFARALTEDHLEVHSIFIDDPIGSFDDMNILGFADLIRSIIMHTDTQIVMTTHDSKIFNIMKRKLDSSYHSSRFYRLPEDLVIEEVNDPEE